MGISIVQAALLKLERAHLKEHGTFADPELDHGDARAYAIGCRCIICVNGHKGRQRKEREDRKEYLARTGEFKPNVRGSSVKHGEYSGYLYGCRCNPCLLAGFDKRDQRRKENIESLAKTGQFVSDRVKHGSMTGYLYGCRCEECNFSAVMNVEYRTDREIIIEKIQNHPAFDKAMTRNEKVITFNSYAGRDRRRKTQSGRPLVWDNNGKDETYIYSHDRMQRCAVCKIDFVWRSGEVDGEIRGWELVIVAEPPKRLRGRQDLLERIELEKSA